MITLSEETVLTAIIALRADKLRYERNYGDVTPEEYAQAILRIDKALKEIETNSKK